MKKSYKIINKALIILSFFIVISLVIFVYNQITLGPRVRIPELVINHDEDNDGIKDLQDIVDGAREELASRPRYRSVYYAGGYPPASEGVCTDVIWRAFKHAGYDLKDMVDSDIANNTFLYPRVLVDGRPDPNIDFRRVQNLDVFFSRFGEALTTEIMVDDIENLAQWQGGDIVVFSKPLNHIGIVSDKRRRDGVPLVIHNGGPFPREQDILLGDNAVIAGHYRFPKEK